MLRKPEGKRQLRRPRHRWEDNIVTRQITSRRIAYSEFIPLALTVKQFTVTPLLPSVVSQLLPLTPFTPTNARLQLTGFSLSSNSLNNHY
jgi:hypothetical protein